jgi:hypothetical protein
MGASSLPHRLCCKPAHKTSAKKTYDHPACPPCNWCFQQRRPMTIRHVPPRYRRFPRRRPTTIQRVPHAMGSLQVHTSGSSQAALFKANSRLYVSMYRQQRTVVLARECLEHSTTHKSFMHCYLNARRFLHIIFQPISLDFMCSIPDWGWEKNKQYTCLCAQIQKHKDMWIYAYGSVNIFVSTSRLYSINDS